LDWIGHQRAIPTGARLDRDGLALGFLLAALLSVTAFSVLTSPVWHPGAPPTPPWCLAAETPAFRFGFAALSSALGDIMGQPKDCEHGDDGISADTWQETTTGVAWYHWCSNTPTFNRGLEHWMLTPNGLEYWVGSGIPPRSLPVVRVPDLREPCTS